MKKVFKVLTLSSVGVFLASIFSTLASAAATTEIQKFGSDIWNSLFSNQEILSRILLAVLLYMVIYSIVETVFKGKRFMNITITLIIVLLAIMFIPPEFIRTIRDQYGIMGAAILSTIPFMIMLVFTVKTGSLVAGRILWVFYMFYYVAIYLYRIFGQDLGWKTPESLIYLGALVAGLFIFIFIGAIRKAIFKGEMTQLMESGKNVATRAKLLHKLQTNELNESYGSETAENNPK